MVLQSKTKIIATLGPASEDLETIKKLILAGVRVFRINCSHSDNDKTYELISRIKKVREELSISVGVLLDLPGPKIRLNKINTNSNSMLISEGERVTFELGEKPCETGLLTTSSINDLNFLKVGDRVFIGDGIIEFVVEAVKNGKATLKTICGGEIKGGKGIEFPDCDVPLPDVTERDFQNLDIVETAPVDFVAISFVRSRKTIDNVREYLTSKGKKPWIISKIERKEALEKIDEILEASDGIMIARGDLALAIPPEKLPNVQIKLIEKANDKAVPVIVATQMLLSMVNSPIPTRAEISDVSFSVSQGADAIMLSEETSVGKFPVRTVEMMTRIASEALKNFDFDQYKKRLTTLGEKDLVEAVCYAAAAAGFKLNAAAIVACTTSGFSVKLISKYRPKPPVFAYTTSEEVARKLTICWGVESIVGNVLAKNDRHERDLAFGAVKRRIELQEGNSVILTGGVKTFQIGGTSLMEIRKV